MKIKLNEDRNIPNNARVSRFTRAARQNIVQRDKELFARKLTELARITQPYVERANNILEKFEQAYHAGKLGRSSNIYIPGERTYSEIILDYMDYGFLNLGWTSITAGDDHFFWLAHDSRDNPFECDLSTNYNEMLGYINHYGWDNLSDYDRNEFMEWINDCLGWAASDIEDLFGKAEEMLNSL